MNETDYFLNSGSDMIRYECVSLSHPNFTQDYHLVRNAFDGLSVEIEGQTVDFEYCPMRVDHEARKEDMDYGVKIILGDVGELIEPEMRRIIAANALDIKPNAVFYEIADGSVIRQASLEVSAVQVVPEGASLELKPPSANNRSVGKVYTLEQFKGLRAFL